MELGLGYDDKGTGYYIPPCVVLPIGDNAQYTMIRLGSNPNSLCYIWNSVSWHYKNLVLGSYIGTFCLCPHFNNVHLICWSNQTTVFRADEAVLLSSHNISAMRMEVSELLFETEIFFVMLAGQKNLNR